jgi:hypothetical protein
VFDKVLPSVREVKSIRRANTKNKLALSIALAAVLTSSLLFISNIYIYASGPRGDSDDRYDNIPGAGECWTDGWDDGANNEYDSNRARECYDKGDQYNQAYGHAESTCNDPNVGSANKEDCEYSQQSESD